MNAAAARRRTGTWPWVLLWVSAVAIAFLLTAANLQFGDLNQDEGWYLYAARLVAEGQVPYADFAYTQPPVLPYAYIPANLLVERWGLAGGRAYTAMLGLLATVLACWLASRLVARPAAPVTALIAFSLCAVNAYHSYFTTVVKTYSLAAALLAGGFLLLTFVGKRGRWVAALGAGVALALAAGVRISAGVALPVVGIALLLDRRRLGNGCWLAFGVGGSVTLAAVFVPFYLAAPEGFRFGVFEYHTARGGGGLVHKAGFISRVVQAYFVPLALLFALGLYRLLGGRARGEGRWTVEQFSRLPLALAAAIGLASLVHLSAPFPYDDYQVMLQPLLAAGVAAWLVRVIGSDRRRHMGAAILMLGLATAAAGSSSINQDWFLLGRDTVWWRLKPEPDLVRLQAAAREVKDLARPGRLVLTQDTYLAVEAGLRVPPGMEMGPFCYYPEWSADRADACRVLNRSMLRELIRTTDARVAAFSDYGLSIRSPEVLPLPDAERGDLQELVDSRYELRDTIRDFGQGHTPLRIFSRSDR